MKFCRNLQRVIVITDPEWAPYWTNYKMLKKFLKALVPPDAGDAAAADHDASGGGSPRAGYSSSHGSGPGGGDAVPDREPREEEGSGGAAPSRAVGSVVTSTAAQMSRDPGEVAFFRLLNSELKKAIRFFDNAQLEFEIREARVREGISIMRAANSLMVSEKWTSMAKSLYRLYKDLLLLETYAIMTYCSFSKILKKHDKVTRHNTRVAFMKNVVNKANFTHYPRLLVMITRCERLYDEVSQALTAEGKSGLCEDERLFINMIQRLNEQVLGTAEEEGAPDMGGRKEQRRSCPPNHLLVGLGQGHSPASSHSSLSSASEVNTLRSLVEENAINVSSKEGLARVSDPCSNAETVRPHGDERGEAMMESTARTLENTEGKDGPCISTDSQTAVEPAAKRLRLYTRSEE